jgi:hypothetical protein
MMFNGSAEYGFPRLSDAPQVSYTCYLLRVEFAEDVEDITPKMSPLPRPSLPLDHHCDYYFSAILEHALEVKNYTYWDLANKASLFNIVTTNTIKCIGSRSVCY